MADVTDPATVPAHVRQDAFRRAMIAFHDALVAAGYRLDALAELEAVDIELGRAAGWEENPNGRGSVRRH